MREYRNITWRDFTQVDWTYRTVPTIVKWIRWKVPDPQVSYGEKAITAFQERTRELLKILKGSIKYFYFII